MMMADLTKKIIHSRISQNMQCEWLCVGSFFDQGVPNIVSVAIFDN